MLLVATIWGERGETEKEMGIWRKGGRGVSGREGKGNERKKRREGERKE